MCPDLMMCLTETSVSGMGENTHTTGHCVQLWRAPFWLIRQHAALQVQRSTRELRSGTRRGPGTSAEAEAALHTLVAHACKATMHFILSLSQQPTASYRSLQLSLIAALRFACSAAFLLICLPAQPSSHSNSTSHCAFHRPSCLHSTARPLHSLSLQWPFSSFEGTDKVFVSP